MIGRRLGTTELSIPTLESQRLILRPFRSSDASEVQRLAGDWAVADTTDVIPHPYEDGVAEAWIESHEAGYDSGRDLTLAITRRRDGQLLGAMTLFIRRAHDCGELGFWVGKPYWNQGICTEAATAMVEHGFTQVNLNRIEAKHFSRNPASGRVLQKLGMTREGEARQSIKRADRYEDVALYAILRGEWTSVPA